jgi:predicted dehydrogenase
LIHKDDSLLNIGVLGAGPISQAAHFEACRKARNARLYAVCDAAEPLLALAAAVHQPERTYADYDAMLADPKLDAVIIGAADQFHVPLARKAVAAGKHVLVEKPLGVTLEECAALQDDLRAAKLVLQIGNNRRVDPGWAFAQHFVAERLGPVISLKAWYYDSAFRYTMTDNLQPVPETSPQARRPGGDPKADKRRYFMLTHGSHLVDTARFFGGEIASVRARHVQRGGAYCWHIAADFASGALGSLDLMVPAQADFEEGLQIFGEGGSVQGRMPLTWFHKSSHIECFSAADRQYHRPLGEDAFTYKLQVEGFADAILRGAPQTGATIEDGLAAMRAMIAVARSVESGQAVALADVTGGL